jgi:hemerythrin-like domain-containing protein
LLIFLHYFGNVLHQAKEESILFPALKSAAECTSSFDLEACFTGHNEERSLIEKARFSLFTDKQGEFMMSAREVIDVVSEHANREERVLFPVASGILSLERANEIAARFQEADARFGFRQRTLLMDLLEERFKASKFQTLDLPLSAVD